MGQNEAAYHIDHHGNTTGYQQLHDVIHYDGGNIRDKI